MSRWFSPPFETFWSSRSGRNSLDPSNRLPGFGFPVTRYDPYRCIVGQRSIRATSKQLAMFRFHSIENVTLRNLFRPIVAVLEIVLNVLPTPMSNSIMFSMWINFFQKRAYTTVRTLCLREHGSQVYREQRLYEYQ